MQVVADANVLVSAAATPDGTCGRLVRALLEAPIELVVSPALLDEVDDVLARPRFTHVSAPTRRRFTALLRHVALVEDDPPPAVAVPGLVDPGDAYLVRLTLAVPGRILVTGDRHLLDLAGALVVLPPDELVRRLEQRPS